MEGRETEGKREGEERVGERDEGMSEEHAVREREVEGGRARERGERGTGRQRERRVEREGKRE